MFYLNKRSNFEKKPHELRYRSKLFQKSLKMCIACDRNQSIHDEYYCIVLYNIPATVT